ncbi:MAG: hypothetical protein ACRD1B_00895, partial [Thermoanaerobaculia bacterium]
MGRRTAAALALLACAPLLRAASADGDLVATVEHFELMRLAGTSSVPVRDVQLTCGHLTLVLKSGSAAPVLAGNEVVGLFFEGQGDLEYRSVDPVEFPAAAYNLKKASSLAFEKSAGALTVRDHFERVLWLSAGAPLPQLPGGSDLWKSAEASVEASAAVGPPLQASFQKERETFRKVRGIPTAFLFGLQRWTAPQGVLVAAEIGGGKEDLRYFFDDVEEHSESLDLLR